MRPVIGLLVRPGVPVPAVRMLGRLRRWADVRATSLPGPAPSAFVATTPRARGVERVARGGRPLLVWVDDGDEVDDALALAGPTVRCATADPAVAAALGGDAIVVADPAASSDLAAWSPFVRRRWRRRAGFPDDLVVTVRPAEAGATTASSEVLTADEPLVDTALAVASAAVVTDAGAARRGLALGCPMVVDPATAAALGIVGDVHARVEAGLVDRADDRRPGQELATDDVAAAALSRRARQLFEARHDAAGAVDRIAAHLGVVARASGAPTPSERLDAVLDAMSTPVHARIRHRAHELVGDLGPGAGSAA